VNSEVRDKFKKMKAEKSKVNTIGKQKRDFTFVANPTDAKEFPAPNKYKPYVYYIISNFSREKSVLSLTTS